MIELTLTLMVIGFWVGLAIGLLAIFILLAMWRKGWWYR